MKLRTGLVLLAVGLFSAAFAPRALADDTNQVTLTGWMCCGKCKLHITKTCQNVLQVQHDGTNINYFLTQNKVSKDFHPIICMNDGEQTTVTGTVKEEDGKEILIATKIDPVK